MGLVAVAGTAAIAVIGFSTWRYDVALSQGAVAARERADATTTAELAAAFWHEHQAAGLYIAVPGPATLRAVTAQHDQFQRLAAQLSSTSGAAARLSRARAVAGNAHYYSVFTQVRDDAGTTVNRAAGGPGPPARQLRQAWCRHWRRWTARPPGARRPRRRLRLPLRMKRA